MKSWTLALAAILASAIAANSFAETIGVSLQGSPGTAGPNYSPGVSVCVTANLGYGKVATTNVAGAFRWQVTSDSSPATFGSLVNSNTSLYAFCIQLFQSTGTSYSVSNLTGAPQGGYDAGYIDSGAAAQMQGLVDKFWNSIDFTNSVPTNYSFNSISYNDNVVAGAFQLAVWEIEYDGGTNPAGESYNLSNATNYFGGGKLTASATTGSDGQKAIDLANAWLNSTLWSSDSTISSVALESTCSQDQLCGIPNYNGGGVPPAPLPASLPAGLGLIIGLAAYRKFRKAKS